MTTMWRKIRENAGLKPKDIIEATGVKKQDISNFELGRRKPNKLIIYYLRLRGTDSDLIIAKYLEKNIK